MSPDVAVVFVCTNEQESLHKALASLPQDTYEIVVVDNASQSPLHINGITVVRRDKVSGLPDNLNFGYSYTTAPFVMLCNCDILFEADAVEELAKFLQDNPKVGVVAPLLLDEQGVARSSARRWYTWPTLFALKSFGRNLVSKSHYQDWDRKAPLKADWVPFTATMVRRAAFDAVGRMDPRFRLYFDDVDICYRMHQGGWEVWCNPAAGIVHLEQRSSAKIFSRAWRWHLASLFKYFFKHGRLRVK